MSILDFATRSNSMKSLDSMISPNSMKFLGALLALLVSLTPGTIVPFLNPASALAADSWSDVIHESRIDSENWAWETNSEGDSFLNAPGYHPLTELNQPMLPVRELLFVIPAGREVVEAWIEPLETRRDKAQRIPSLSGPLVTDGGEVHAVSLMNAKDGAFPASWGDFGGTHTWRGYNLLAMNLYPVRSLNDAEGQFLEYLEAYAVRVRYGDGSTARHTLQRERFVPGEKEANVNFLNKIVANPTSIAGTLRQAETMIETEGGFNPTRTPSLSGSAVDYLIITNEEMKEEFQVLADFKTQLGMTSLVVTREFIAANYRQGADIQETIRMFLQDAYAKWGTQYVLLGGDTEVLPTRYVSNTFYPYGSHTDIPVDLYFACLDGNWNANGNSLFCEVGNASLEDDEADLAEELYLGRATVTTAAEAAVFVSKVMEYQMTPASEQWPNRVLFAAEVLFPADYNPGDNIRLNGALYSDQMVEENLAPCTDMEYLRMYEAPSDPLNPGDLDLTREALIDSLNTGHYGIFNQIGHGFYFNMSVGDANFMNTDADALTNEEFFLMFSLNCASAAFDYSCLMERFVKNPHGGSVASIGSARAAFPTISNYFQQEFFQALYCQDNLNLGELIALSRLPFLSHVDSNSFQRWTFQNYSLLGDPSLPIWSGVPQDLNVSTGSLATGPNHMTMTVNDSLGQPVSGARVCLSRDGEDHAVGLTDQNGQATLDYLATRAGAVDLFVSGKNLAVKSLQVPIQSGDTYFEQAITLVVDDNSGNTQGNGNQELDAGEVVSFKPILVETLGQESYGLVGTLSCSTDGVLIHDNTVDFVNVDGFGSTFPLEPYMLTLDPAMPDGTVLDFRLEMRDEDDDNFVVEWTMMARAPEPEVVFVDWEDETFGNGDGHLDNGERVVLRTRLKNFGTGTLDNLDLTLRSANSHVTLYDTLGTYGSLEFLETTGEITNFSLAIDDNLLRSRAVLHMEDNHGRIWTHEIFLQRLAAPEAITTDPSLGADVIVLRWEPVADEDIYGYNVYRSLSENGPFERVNTDIIVGTSYFRDEGLAQLTRFYYQVEALASPLVPGDLSTTVSQSTAPSEVAGFPVEFSNETSSHLAFGDVDGDGDGEVVLVSDEVYVWHHDGTELLDGDNYDQTLGVFSDMGVVLSPAGVALAQLDDQPGLEMVISILEPDPGLIVLKADGSTLDGWPQSLNYGSGTHWNWGTPAVADLDGDGDLEIVVNTLNGMTFAFHHDGTELIDGDDDPSTDGIFHIRAGSVWEWPITSPTLVDLDGNGTCEVVFGTADDADGARVEALQSDGSSLPGFPYYVNGRINSSVAAADLDGDGSFELIVPDRAPSLHVIRADGTPYEGFPVEFDGGILGGVMPSVAIGDMDADGSLDIVFARNEGGDLGHMVIVDADIAGGTSGQVFAGWPISLPGSSEASPVIGDINGDGQPDILFGIGGGDEESPNNLYAFQTDGSSLDGFPITLGGPLMPSPVICDFDHDQDVDIIMGGWDRLVHVWDMPFAYDPQNVPWPTFAGNMRRDGVYGREYLTSVDDSGDIPAAGFAMNAPYPNPFNPSTSVRLYVPTVGDSSELELVVYDLQGRKIRTLHNGSISPGWHTMVWDGKDDLGRGQGSGMYFMRAHSGAHSSIHKMTLLK